MWLDIGWEYEPRSELQNRRKQHKEIEMATLVSLDLTALTLEWTWGCVTAVVISAGYLVSLRP